MKVAEEKFSLIIIIKKFIEYKKIILYVTLVLMLLTIGYVYFILKPIFVSTVSVKTTSKSSGLSGLLSAGGVPDLAGLTDMGSGSAKEMALYENILMSRKSIEAAIIKFKLNNDWEYKYMEDAVKFFRENVLEITKDKIAGTMDVSINDTDPNRAKEIAEFMISQLNNIYVSLSVTSAKNNREFLEARYNNIAKDLQSAEDSLKNFQDVFGISPDLTVKAAWQAVIQLQTEVKTEEIKLELLKKVLSPDQAEVKIQEERIQELKNQLAVIENSSSGSNTDLQIKGKPDVVLNFLRLQRNVEIQNKILTFVLPLFEQAKIEEKKETPTVIVIDEPNLPEKKSKPRRVKLLAIAFFIYFFGALSVCIVYDKVKEMNLLKSILDNKTS